MQGVAQAVVAALILTDLASVGSLVAFQILYGIGAGLIIPAEIGLVPQTVSPERLQQANALQGLSRNVDRRCSAQPSAAPSWWPEAPASRSPPTPSASSSARCC